MRAWDRFQYFVRRTVAKIRAALSGPASILAATLIGSWSNPLEKAVWRQGSENDCLFSLVQFFVHDAESCFPLAASRLADGESLPGAVGSLSAHVERRDLDALQK